MNLLESEMKFEEAEKNLESKKSKKRAMLHFNNDDALIIQAHLAVLQAEKKLDKMYIAFENEPCYGYTSPNAFLQDYYSNY